jgi:hypothetical protein
VGSDGVAWIAMKHGQNMMVITPAALKDMVYADAVIK